MIYRRLGKSDSKISVLGFGCWALAKHGWKDVNQEEAIKTLEKSVDIGINFFDTAPIYGFGKSEELVGEVLKGNRKNVLIATKCGLRWSKFGKVSHDLSRDSIKYEVEASLKRLKTDYIDLYQIHWPDDKTPLSKVFSSLEELKREGVIKNIGVSNFNLGLLKEACELSDVVSVQEQYNLLQRGVEDSILPFCIEKSIGFMAYSPLAQGILSGKVGKEYKLGKNDVRRFNPLFRDREAFEKVEKLEKPLAKTALKYVLEKEGVSSVLVSMTKIRHLLENMKFVEEIF
jgi:aryl-alcohol dehydrogenase-like predicted oxidoreductase